MANSAIASSKTALLPNPPRDACSFFWQRRKMRAHDFPAPVFLCEDQCGAAMDCLHLAVLGSADVGVVCVRDCRTFADWTARELAESELRLSDRLKRSAQEIPKLLFVIKTIGDMIEHFEIVGEQI